MTQPAAWYCVHTKPKCEHLAAASLSQLENVETYCPRIRFQRSTPRGKVWFVEALFPSYFFARFNPEESLRAVKYAQNVIRVLAFGDNLVTIPDQTITDIREEMQHQDLREVRLSLKVGDEVELTEGPMRGFKGIVDGLLKGQDRVRILLEFLGRHSVVEIEAGKILNSLKPRSAL